MQQIVAPGSSGRAAMLHQRGRGAASAGHRAAAKHVPSCPQRILLTPVAAVVAPAPSSTASAAPSASVQAPLEDKFLAKNLPALASSAPASSSLATLRASAWSALAGTRMPTTRVEEYRFTDISGLLRASLVGADGHAAVSASAIKELVPPQAAHTYAVLVNGALRPELSNLTGLPKGVYVGGSAGAPQEALQQLGSQSSARGGPFALINGALASDALVVVVPSGVVVEAPLYVLNLTTSGAQAEGSVATSAPRLLLHAGEGSVCSLVEESLHLGAASGGSNGQPQQQQAAGEQQQQQVSYSYLTCPVAELFLSRGAQVAHGYAVRESTGAVHVKATLVEQEEESSYTLTEARLGGSLTRHDVAVQQNGARTQTDMRHFVLAGTQQLHDLHTKLSLNHPEGQANQLHKCIVASPTGRGVFDGNVKVNRLAQRTDAGQLSRNLLLAQRATVNVKPNLQIIADDVKCTHGCAVSDLSDEELFYFRARGINAMAARQALVTSFGAEVTQRLGLPALQARLQADVAEKLRGVDFAAAAAAAAAASAASSASAGSHA